MVRISEDDARTAVLRMVSTMEESSGRPLALWNGRFGRAGIEDHGDVWTVAWNSVAYLASGNICDQALAGPRRGRRSLG